MCRRRLREEWTRERKALDTCRQTKLWLSTAQAPALRKIKKKSRRQRKTLIEILTGHNNLKYMQHCMDNGESPNSRFCNEYEETAEHLIKDCPVFWSHRRDCFKDKRPDIDDWEPEEILKFAQHHMIDQALHPCHTSWFSSGKAGYISICH